MLSRDGGYRRLARYFCKPDEMIPLGKHPWGVARGMRQLIPPRTVRVQTRAPAMPRETFWSERSRPLVREVNGMAAWRIEYADWIAKPPENARTFILD